MQKREQSRIWMVLIWLAIAGLFGFFLLTYYVAGAVCSAEDCSVADRDLSDTLVQIGRILAVTSAFAFGFAAFKLREMEIGRDDGVFWQPLRVLDFFIKLDINDTALALLMLAPAAVLICMFALYPIVQGLIVSLNRVNPATLETTYIGLDNFESVLRSDTFWDSLWRTVLYVVSTNAVTLVLGMAISLLVHQELVGRNIVRGVVLFPYLVPAIVIALTWRFMLDPTLGLVNVWLKDLGVIDREIPFLTRPQYAMWVIIVAGIWKYTPFMIIMFLARLQVIPVELEEAARLDGASGLQVFWYITIPWMMPVIIIALLLRTIWMFNEFEMVYLFAFGGPLDKTTTLPVLVQKQAFAELRLGEAAATAGIMLIILMVMAMGYFRLYGRAESELH